MKAELLYPTSWWDGPVSGLAKLESGEICWFWWSNPDNPDKRKYTLFRLTDDQLRFELQKKLLFETCVGTHWSFDIPPEERVQRDHELQRAYFSVKYKWLHDLEHEKKLTTAYFENEVIGAITEWSNSLRRR